MQTVDTISVPKEQIAAMEQRAVRVNGALLRMRLALDRGDLEAIANLRALAQELNWTNRRALLDAGAPDSILAAAGLTSATPDEDDQELVDAEQLDLATLRAEFRNLPE